MKIIKGFGMHLLNPAQAAGINPEKDIPTKPNPNPDPTKSKPGGNEPKKVDPTRIEEPHKNDPTRIHEPQPSKPSTPSPGAPSPAPQKHVVSGYRPGLI